MRSAALIATILCLTLGCTASMAQTEPAPATPETPATVPDTVPDAAPDISGPAVPITSIEVTGNTLVPTEDLRAVITLRPGQTYAAEAYRASADAMERLYSERGFQAVVSPGPAPISESGVLTFPVIEAVVEDIGVRGNKKTRTGTVLRVVEIERGELYRREQAQADVRALFNLGIFNDVTYRLEPGSALGRVNVIYTVDEAKTGQIAAGLSYSGSSGIIGQVEVVETNLGGQANALAAFIQSGGKYYRSGFQVAFHDPFIGSRHTALDVGAYAKTIYRFSGNDFFRSDFDTGIGYDEFRTGGDFTLSRRLRKDLRGALGFRGSSVKAHYSYNLFIPGEGEDPNILVRDLRNPGIPDGSIYAGQLSAANDRRDYALDPARGGVQVAAFEIGRVKTDTQTFRTGFDLGTGEPITQTVPGDSGNITRLSLDLRHYFSKGRTEEQPNKAVRVLATRLVAGTVSGTVPFWEQFFVGGIGLGGVQYARFLTMDAFANDPFVATSQALRGYSEGRFWGKNMIVGSVEYRIPLGETVRGVVFVDAGDAWKSNVAFLDPLDDDPKEIDDSFKLHSSVGVGLRVMTPFGPIRVDFGVGSEGSRTHFSIGQVF